MLHVDDSNRKHVLLTKHGNCLAGQSQLGLAR